MSKLVTLHKFRVENGNMKFVDLPKFRSNLDEMEGHYGYIALLEEDAKPTPSHRGYYWGVLIPAALKTEEFGGWDKNDVHNYLKGKVGVKTTTKMNVKEFAEYVERAKDILATHDVYVEEIDKYYEST